MLPLRICAALALAWALGCVAAGWTVEPAGHAGTDGVSHAAGAAERRGFVASDPSLSPSERGDASDENDDDEDAAPESGGAVCRALLHAAPKPALARSDSRPPRSLFLALHRFRC